MSSDSEDDCYNCNSALKLQKMKQNYQEDKIDTNTLLNESNELEELLKITKKQIQSPAAAAHIDDSLDNLCASLDAAKHLENIKQSTKRVTRSASKKAAKEPVVTPTAEPQAARGRRRIAKNNQDTPVNGNQGTRGSHFRGRTPRRARGRQRNTPARNNYIDTNMPIFNVGNTLNYPDSSHNQELFNRKIDENVIVIGEDVNESLNEELSVKVYWQNSEYFKFTLRRFQKIKQIFKFFADREKVEYDKLLFTFNDNILTTDDTPDSIDYNISKFIDGGIVKQSVSHIVKLDKVKPLHGISIKFQFQNVKKPFETSLDLDEKLYVSMTKCAEHLEVSLDSLKFIFDGEQLTGQQTPRQLEFEGGECVDVKFVSS